MVYKGIYSLSIKNHKVKLQGLNHVNIINFTYIRLFKQTVDQKTIGFKIHYHKVGSIND